MQKKKFLKKVVVLGVLATMGLTNIVAKANAEVNYEALKDASYTWFIPQGLGSLHTYTVWDGIKWGGDCRNLINHVTSYAEISDSYGIVTYGDAFAGATTSTYGEVGDVYLVVNEGGIVYPVCMADTKSQVYCAWDNSPANMWGHQNGNCIVEFEILSSCVWSLYKGSGGYVSEPLNRDVYKVINIGSAFEDISLLDREVQMDYARANGLGGYTFMVNPYEGVTIL